MHIVITRPKEDSLSLIEKLKKLGHLVTHLPVIKIEKLKTKKINLDNHAVATSGIYNQSIEIDNFEYSHIFDPRIGQPSKNNVVSVTVISSSCIYSDALATSLKVLGKDKGLDLINDLDDVECMFIVKENEEFRNYLSRNFSDFFID